MLEALWLGLLGLAAGFVLTLGPYYYLSTTGIDFASALDMSDAEVAGVALPTVMRLVLYPEYAAALAGVVLLATLASGLYPAWQAGRIQPVESIRLV